MQQSPPSPDPNDSLQTLQDRQRALRGVSHDLELQLERYGYDRIDTPLVQDAELFLTKAGDQIVNRLFTFERGGRDLSLRPEFTAPAAKLYVDQYPDGGSVVRWQFHGYVFEDSAKSDAAFQRYRVGAELIGAGDYTADAEIVAMAANCIGATNQPILKIGHVGLLRELLSYYGLDPRTSRFLLTHLSALGDPAQGVNYLLARLDELLIGIPDEAQETAIDQGDGDTLSAQYILDVLLDATQHGTTMGGRTRHDIVRRLLEKRRRAAERPQISAALEFLQAYGAIDAPAEEAFTRIERLIAPDHTSARTLLDTWKKMIDLVIAYGVPPERIRIQPALTRSWDYYTGILFDLTAANPEGTLLGGGGRYDELVRLLGSSVDVPAVGFVYHADTIAETWSLNNVSVQYHLTYDPFLPLTDAIRWSQHLRETFGLSIVIDQDVSAEMRVDAAGKLHWKNGIFSIDDAESFAQMMRGGAQ